MRKYEIRIWQDTGAYGEPTWHASYPGGMCSTGGRDARDWVLEQAMLRIADQGIEPDEYTIVYGHFEKVWVSHA